MADMPDRPWRPRHVPVLLDRCVELLTPALTRRSRRRLRRGPGRCHARRRRPRRAVPHRAARAAARSVSTATPTRCGSQASGWRRSATGSCSSAPATTASTACWPNPVTGQANRVDGVLFDLGVSSMQLDRTERGFSYSARRAAGHADGPGRRADRGRDRQHLRREGPDAASCASSARSASPAASPREIVRRRASASRSPRTGELVELLYEAIPAPARRTGGHPAKRTFQALRIAVNGELDSLRAALPAAMAALRRGRPHRR